MAIVTSVVRLAVLTGDNDTETWTYLVAFSDNSGTVAQARGANDGITSIPSDGSKYSSTRALFSKSSAKQNEDEPTVWEVTVTWTAEQLNEVDDEEADKWDLQVASAALPYDRPVSVDKDSNPILNKAGYAFNPSPVVTDYDAVWNVSFKTSSGSVVTSIRNSVGRVNTDTISFDYKGISLSWAAGKLRLTNYRWSALPDIVPADEEEEPTPAFQVDIELVERVADVHHDLSLANVGFHDTNGERDYDEKGQQLTEPSYLDGSGEFVDPGAISDPLTFDINARVTFGSFLGGL